MIVNRATVTASALALLVACDPQAPSIQSETRSSSYALTATENAVLVPADVVDGDGFGRHMVVDGDTLIAGSYWSDAGADDSGIAHVFRWNGSAWIEEASILPATVGVGDQFGSSMALDGDTAAIAAVRDGQYVGWEEGTVYLFERSGSTWSEVARLVSPAPTFLGQFGVSLALDGDTLLVGAAGENDDRGNVYVYQRDPITRAWHPSGQITGPPLAAGDRFGAPLALDGDLAVVAAPFRDAGARDSGAVYAFRRHGNDWVMEREFLPPTPAPEMSFGFHQGVAVDGDTIVIGNYEENTYFDNNGAVFVYTHDGSAWSQQAKLLPSDPSLIASVGWSVVVQGDRLVAGGHLVNGASFRTGGAYVFERHGNTWAEVTKLIASNGRQLEYFGSYVGLTGEQVVVSAIHDDAAGPYTGGVYVFHVAPSPGPACPLPGEDIGSFCTPECPCEHGQGDCDSGEDCLSGFCLRDAGLAFGYGDPDLDVCSDVCPTTGVGAGNYCTPECPCEHGQGDCDDDDDCAPGLRCAQNVGAAHGLPADTDVCVRR